MKQKKFTKDERNANRQANDLKLFLMFGPDRWDISDAVTGKLIGWWKSATGRYRIRGSDGVCADRRTVLRLAAERTVNRPGESK